MTEDAGRKAGLEKVKLMREPEAAALAYGLDKASANSVSEEGKKACLTLLELPPFSGISKIQRMVQG